jgi:deoxyribodipyrimidine photo-lyase
MRLHHVNNAPERSGGEYVLYWMRHNRRPRGNHGLEHAAAVANRHKVPLLVYESLANDYPYASDRFHQFVLEGVPDTAARLAKRGAGYLFRLGDQRVEDLARKACAVVTDDYPIGNIDARFDVACHAIDSSCVVPMRILPKKEYAAYTIRPKIHRLLKEHLLPVDEVEIENPWQGPPPQGHIEVTPSNIAKLVAGCPIDHSVKPALGFRGGAEQARLRLKHFLEHNAERYAEQKNEPSAHATSNLSPYLHFGHISAIEVALEAYGLETFLEELIVRRELAFNHALFAGDIASFENLPDWARKTLRDHADDERDPCYAREQMERAETYDDLWNATQHELLLTGKIHGYYRMYWGKKILEWSAAPEEARDTMIYLHDKYALDGQDPNTYGNILWCFGLHDRPWKERPIFGKVRYMSLNGMKRKTNVEAYITEIQSLRMSR